MVTIRKDNPSQSNRDLIKQILDEVCEIFDIPDSKKKEAENWGFVKHEISRRLQPRITGRLFPIKQRNSGGSPRQVLRLLRDPSPFHGCYPRKLKSDKDKHRWLKQQLENKYINQQIYYDLKEVLDV